MFFAIFVPRFARVFRFLRLRSSYRCERGKQGDRRVRPPEPRRGHRRGRERGGGWELWQGSAPMTLAAGFGYVLISLGPALSLFVSVIAKKPFLILTLLARFLFLFPLPFFVLPWSSTIPLSSPAMYSIRFSFEFLYWFIYIFHYLDLNFLFILFSPKLVWRFPHEIYINKEDITCRVNGGRGDWAYR